MPDTGELLTPTQAAKLRTMAKKKQEEAEVAVKLISYRPSPAVQAALDEYRGRFEYQPDKSAVIERALRDFFRAQKVRLADEA